MSTDDSEAGNGFTKAESPDDNQYDGDDLWIDRPPEGESVQGIVLSKKPDRGKFNNLLLELKLTDDLGYGDEYEQGTKVLMFANKNIEDTIEANDIESGHTILIECTDSYEFENDDGETQTGHNFDVYYSE